MDAHSLQLLEFDRVTAAIAARADSARARVSLAAWRPFAERVARGRENAVLAEAIRRQREPEAWCAVGRGELGPRLDRARADALDGPGLVEVGTWLDAGEETRAAWSGEPAGSRYPALAAIVSGIPRLEKLRQRLAAALEPDGRVSDDASPALRRARAALAGGERDLESRLTRWASTFGENAYVTRHGERFVALVPAAGFPRRRGLVHDVSGSGQSLFVEPLEMCEANNRLIELRALAQEEERRVLRELASAVLDAAAPLATLENALVELDTLRARARWAREFDAIALDPGGDRLRLRRARHPLMVMGERAGAIVPLDLELGPDARLLLVSGPNMGGKTVLMKTVGLAVAMAHAALPVPADEGSAVPEIETMIADLGDEQSVERGLSTFAAHLQTLRAMSEHAGPRSLLLCDELGAGTDPDEGAALGRSLLEHFAERRAWGVVTTHLGSLKRVPGEVPGVASGSLEFDAETLVSHYRFRPGIPGASHALAVAARLGFPPALIERARSLTPDSVREFERLLASLDETQRRMEREIASLDAARAEAAAEASRHRDQTEASRRELEALRRRLTRESEGLLANARELWQTVQREARRAEKRRASADDVRDRIVALERDAAALEREAAAALGAPASASPAPFAVEVGQRVRVLDLGVEAEVVSAPDPEGKVGLRRGSWSIQSHVSRLARSGGDGSPEAPQRPPNGGATWSASEEAPALEIHLRGMEVDEALSALDQGLDRAVVAGLGEIRIVHGIGRGVLRAAVERHLRGHPQIASHRLGAIGEGGRGVTVAKLR